MNKSIFGALPIVAAHYANRFGVQVKFGGASLDSDGDKTIYIPALSSDSPKVDVLWGYLAHAAGLCRYSNRELLDGLGPFKRSLMSVFEGVFVERQMMAEFPGISGDLDTTVAYLVSLKDDLKITGLETPAGLIVKYLSLGLRYKVLSQPCAHQFIDAETAFAQVFPLGMRVGLNAIMRQASDITSTYGSLELTEKVVKLIQDTAEQMSDDQSAPTSQSDSDSDGSTDKSDQGDGSLDKDASGSECSSGGQSSVSDDSNQQSTNGSMSSQGQDTDQSEKGDGQPSIQSGEASAQSSDSSNETPTCSADDLQSVLSGEDNVLPSDPFESLKQDIAKEARKCDANEKISIPAQITESSPFALHPSDDALVMIDNARDATYKIRAQVIGLIQSLQRKRPKSSYTGRKINSKRLATVVSGNLKVFTKKADKVFPNTSVHLLCDLSSSMNRTYRIAQEASLALCLALESVKGVEVALTYFGGNSDEPVHAAVPPGSKAMNELDRLAAAPNGSTPMAEAIWYAAYKLSQTKHQRKIMIVVTDGEPNRGDESKTHHAIKLCLNAEIEMLGIGIKSPSVSNYFQSHVVIDSVNELQTALFGFINTKFLSVA